MAQLVGGTYELKAMIGRGPHGVVWQAQREDTGEDFALKVLSSDFAQDPSVVDRFIRERPVLTAYLNSTFVRVRELLAEAGSLALATELVAGEDLHHRLSRLGPLDVESAAEIGAACAEAVAAAHAVGVVHCGVKPSNILLTHDSAEVRVTDCRVARLARGHGEGSARYSDPGYRAPEVELGGPPVPATDVFGIGLVLYELVTGTPLHGGAPDLLGQSPQRLRMEASILDDRLRNVVLACLAEDPADRPTGTQLAVQLRGLLSHGGRATSAGSAIRQPGTPQFAHAGTSLQQKRTEPHAPARHPGRRRMVVVSSAAVLASGLVVATVAGLSGSRLGQLGSPNAPRASQAIGPSFVSARATPRLPTTAADDSPGAAEAFVRYWFETLNHATTTGDTEPLQAASSPNCKVCADAVGLINSVYKSGRAIRGGDYTVRSVHIDSFFDLRHPTLRVVFDRSPRATVTAAGHGLDTLPAVTFATCQVVLERADGRWRVRENQSVGLVA